MTAPDPQLERVARAIYEERWHVESERHWENEYRPIQGEYLRLARAAVAAMGDTTPESDSDGASVPVTVAPQTQHNDEAAIWRALSQRYHWGPYTGHGTGRNIAGAKECFECQGIAELFARSGGTRP